MQEKKKKKNSKKKKKCTYSIDDVTEKQACFNLRRVVLEEL
jgi:hypothetical protein